METKDLQAVKATTGITRRDQLRQSRHLQPQRRRANAQETRRLSSKDIYN